MKQKEPKSTLLANTRGLITTKQTKPRPVASAAPHLITPADGGVIIVGNDEGFSLCNCYIFFFKKK